MAKKKEVLHLNAMKLPICGVPLRCDPYIGCTFGCTYCFARFVSNDSKQDTVKVADVNDLEEYMYGIHILNDGRIDNLKDKMVKEKYTWHCGGMADPFQPAEQLYQNTAKVIEISKKYNQTILFSTKSDTVYNANITPELHTFQLSITNMNNDKSMEPNVPPIDKRIEFYKQLKKEGFKVGIRVQPFYPDNFTDELVDTFRDADQFIFQTQKIYAGNTEYNNTIVKKYGLQMSDYDCNGSSYRIKGEIAKVMYNKAITKLEKYGIPYSAVSGHCMGVTNNHKCCCGDRLVPKPTNFSYLSMYGQYGCQYTMEQLKNTIGDNLHKEFYMERDGKYSTPNIEINKGFYDKRCIWSPAYGLGEEALTTTKQKIIQEKKKLRTQVHDYERYIAEYSSSGVLEKIYEKTDFTTLQLFKIREKIRENKKYNDKYYKFNNINDFPKELNLNYFCIIGDKKYYSSKEV